MKVFAIIHIFVAATLLTTTTATDTNSVRGARQLGGSSIITYSQIKLTQGNEVSPFIGVPFATGIATVKLDFNPSRKNAKWKVCIQTNVVGFTPGLLHIHKGKISENGGAVVDFSDMLGGNPSFSGCVTVAQSLFNDIKGNPVRRLPPGSTFASRIALMLDSNCLHLCFLHFAGFVLRECPRRG
jgi:hypothetical protein